MASHQETAPAKYMIPFPASIHVSSICDAEIHRYMRRVEQVPRRRMHCGLTCLQEWVGTILGDDAVGLGLLGLVLDLKFVLDLVVLLGEPLLGFEGGNAAGS